MMKAILILIWFASCGGEKPLVVCMDEELPKDAIKVWEPYTKITFMSKAYALTNNITPDVWITISTNTPKEKYGTNRLKGVTYWSGKGKRPRPVLIRVWDGNKVRLAHEFGHVLRLHHNTNHLSIMNPRIEALDWNLTNFKEFNHE